MEGYKAMMAMFDHYAGGTIGAAREPGGPIGAARGSVDDNDGWTTVKSKKGGMV